MLRLPSFRYRVPSDLAEAVALKAGYGDGGIYLAGGTDLLPKMKRGQAAPRALIPVGHLPELSAVTGDGAGRLRLGAGLRLAALAADPRVRETWPALARAAGRVATPAVRNMATLGGNLCLDTRCGFYDQSRAWRRAVDFCLKQDGDACRVAGSSHRCWAVQSSDTSAFLTALDAEIELAGPDGVRTVAAGEFYRDDGIRPLAKDPGELVTAVRLPVPAGSAASYVRVGRRFSFDFPVLSVAAWVRRDAPGGPVREARVVLGAVASAPVAVADAAAALVGRRLDGEAIDAAAEAAWRRARPLENADLTAGWRKAAVKPFVARALRELAETNGQG